jgi:hypothetical protein
VEKYEAEQRRLGDARRETLGLTWPLGEAEEASDEAVPRPTLVVESPAVMPAPAASADSTRESVRVPAPAPALMAEDHAYATPRALSSPAREVIIPAGLRPRHPCPCGSGLRFKHCHGKTGSEETLENPAMRAGAATQH